MVVIPYQFRSVSMQERPKGSQENSSRRNPLSIQVCFNQGSKGCAEHLSSGRNPLSIQVCFNRGQYYSVTLSRAGRNPLSIQVCFNTVWLVTEPRQLSPCRNPLSIQVCFNTAMHINALLNGVVIPYQFRSVSMCHGKKAIQGRNIWVVIPYQFRSVSILTEVREYADSTVS